VDPLFVKWAAVVALAFLGGLDTTALALSNRRSLGNLRFSSFWALLNAVVHVAAKAVAPLLALSMGPKSYQCLVALVALWVLYEAAHSVLHPKEKSRVKLIFPGILLGCLDAVPMSFFKLMVTVNTIESLLLSGLILLLMPLVALRIHAFRKAEGLARWGHFVVFSIVAPTVLFGLFMSEQSALIGAIATAIAAIALMVFVGLRRRSHH
jgi:hypothetical protein